MIRLQHSKKKVTGIIRFLLRFQDVNNLPSLTSTTTIERKLYSIFDLSRLTLIAAL